MLMWDWVKQDTCGKIFGQIYGLLKDGPSIKCVTYETFLLFILIFLKLGDVVVAVSMCNY